MLDTLSKYIGTTQGITMVVCATVGLIVIVKLMSLGGKH